MNRIIFFSMMIFSQVLYASGNQKILFKGDLNKNGKDDEVIVKWNDSEEISATAELYLDSKDKSKKTVWSTKWSADSIGVDEYNVKVDNIKGDTLVLLSLVEDNGGAGLNYLLIKDEKVTSAFSYKAISLDSPWIKRDLSKDGTYPFLVASPARCTQKYNNYLEEIEIDKKRIGPFSKDFEECKNKNGYLKAEIGISQEKKFYIAKITCLPKDTKEVMDKECAK